MKKQLFFLSFFLLLALVLPAQVFDTLPTDEVIAVTDDVPMAPPAITVEWLLNPQNGVFAAGLFVIMWLSSFIPGLRNLDDKRKRALVVGLVMAVAISIWRLFDKSLSFTNFLGMAVTFVQVQLGYMFIIEPTPLKTPDPKKTNPKTAAA